VYENLLNCGFERVISVEPQSRSCNTDQLSRQFPQVKCIIALEPVTQGDMMNIGMAEAESSHVLMLYDDLCTENVPFTAAMAKRFISLDQYCVAPKLVSSSIQNIPIVSNPSSHHSVFEVSSSMMIQDGIPTLYPFDAAGFYDRNRYIRLGGADYTVTSSYWQNLDLSFRSWLWGEKTTIASSFVLTYGGDIPSEERTPDLSYLRFYLKNLLPVYNTDHAKIPSASFFPFGRRSSCGLSESLWQFRDAQRWTDENKYRFKMDAASLIDSWGKKR
jgi:hypothetical protein